MAALRILLIDRQPRHAGRHAIGDQTGEVPPPGLQLRKFARAQYQGELTVEKPVDLVLPLLRVQPTARVEAERLRAHIDEPVDVLADGEVELLAQLPAGTPLKREITAGRKRQGKRCRNEWNEKGQRSLRTRRSMVAPRAPKWNFGEHPLLEPVL